MNPIISYIDHAGTEDHTKPEKWVTRIAYQQTGR